MNNLRVLFGALVMNGFLHISPDLFDQFSIMGWDHVSINYFYDVFFFYLFESDRLFVFNCCSSRLQAHFYDHVYLRIRYIMPLLVHESHLFSE